MATRSAIVLVLCLFCAGCQVRVVPSKGGEIVFEAGRSTNDEALAMVIELLAELPIETLEARITALLDSGVIDNDWRENENSGALNDLFAARHRKQSAAGDGCSCRCRVAGCGGHP